MTPQDLAQLQQLVERALQNVEFINKVWIAGSAVVVSLIAAIVSAATQILVSRWQRRTQEKLASQQAEQQKRALEEQLTMQELASRRTAIANIAAKRQIWIDELRKDMAAYLSTWQEISFRWDAMVSKPRTKSVSDDEVTDFSQPIAAMRRDAHEIQLRIELRLNMAEEKHQYIREKMQKLEQLTILYQRDKFSSIPPEEIQTEVKKCISDIVSKLQEILKEEWDRIKKESYADPKESFRISGLLVEAPSSAPVK